MLAMLVQVPVYVNKVGPYFNTHETYHYYSLPVCHPDKIVHRTLTLGEVLDGDRMAESKYKIKFGEVRPPPRPGISPLNAAACHPLCQLSNRRSHFSVPV